MDPPPPPAAPPLSSTAVAVTAGCPDSGNSSPRSRATNPSDEPSVQGGTATAKLRLMCSYGGHIVPRPHDKSLCYVGGDTRIIVTDRHVTLSDLTHRLSKTLLGGKAFTLKYQLPSEDLDSLISVSTDEDLENMIEEYDRLLSAAATSSSRKTSRLRLFLFTESKTPSFNSLSVLENSAKSDDWFLNALNGATRGGEFPESASVNCLLGLDDAVPSTATNSKEAPVNSNSSGSNKQAMGVSQDVHSVPDSPILETTSSFGSTSSSPSMANLPPIRVHVEDQRPHPTPSPPGPAGIEDQFSQIGIVGGPTGQKMEDGGFFIIPEPAPVVPPQSQAKPTTVADLASPDSVSSDSSVSNPRQRPVIYQDPTVQFQNQNQNQNPSSRVPIAPVDPKLSGTNPNYLYPAQFDQQIQKLNQHQQQQPHFVQSGSQYIPPGAVPSPAYYILYPPQQQYPSAYVSARPAQAYNLQSSFAPSMGPQMGTSQNPQQYLGYPPVHHQSQSITPTSIAATGNYTYEFTEPMNPRVMYTQPVAPQVAVQYQNASLALSEASAQNRAAHS